MNKFKAVVGSIIMATLGYFIIDNLNTSVVSFKQNTLSAATAPKLSYVTQRRPSISIEPITIETTITDSVVVHDTVEVTNTKYVRVPATKHTTDTVYVDTATLQNVTTDSVKNRSPGGCDEQPVDVTLTIDGNVVYSSKTSDEP